MEFTIREMTKSEIPLLEDFLYYAIFLPKGVKSPPKSIIKTEEMQVYIKDFGNSVHDKSLVAVKNNEVVGCVWVRIMRDYGHIDDETPSFAISVKKDYRGFGIGTKLMMEMLDLLKKLGYSKTSLAVQKANYAVKMYEKVSFEIIDENEDEYIMLYKFNN